MLGSLNTQAMSLELLCRLNYASPSREKAEALDLEEIMLIKQSQLPNFHVTIEYWRVAVFMGICIKVVLSRSVLGVTLQSKPHKCQPALNHLNNS